MVDIIVMAKQNVLFEYPIFVQLVLQLVFFGIFNYFYYSLQESTIV